MAAAEAHLRGIERRIAAKLNPHVGSVASVFISRWDVAIAGKVPEELTDRLGIAIAGRIYKAYLDLLINPRWQRVFNAGGPPATVGLSQHRHQGSQARPVLPISRTNENLNRVRS